MNAVLNVKLVTKVPQTQQLLDRPVEWQHNFLHAWLVPTSWPNLKGTEILCRIRTGNFARVVARARDVKHCTSMAYYRQPVVETGTSVSAPGPTPSPLKSKPCINSRSIKRSMSTPIWRSSAYNQQVFTLLPCNNLPETFLEEILNLMVDQKTSQVTISCFL